MNLTMKLPVKLIYQILLFTTLILANPMIVMNMIITLTMTVKYNLYQ